MDKGRETDGKTRRCLGEGSGCRALTVVIGLLDLAGFQSAESPLLARLFLTSDQAEKIHLERRVQSACQKMGKVA